MDNPQVCSLGIYYIHQLRTKLLFLVSLDILWVYEIIWFVELGLSIMVTFSFIYSCQWYFSASKYIFLDIYLFTCTVVIYKFPSIIHSRKKYLTWLVFSYLWQLSYSMLCSLVSIIERFWFFKNDAVSMEKRICSDKLWFFL